MGKLNDIYYHWKLDQIGHKLDGLGTVTWIRLHYKEFTFQQSKYLYRMFHKRLLEEIKR